MTSILRFAGCEIDIAARQLRSQGKPVALGSRAFDVLCALASRPGVVLTKDELLDHVWGSKPVGDFNLHVQISTLRRALGHDAIHTVPGRGYAFALLHVNGHASLSSSSLPTAALPSPQLPRLIDREHDLAQVTSMLAAQRHVVITGAGGVGKTSLARAVLLQQTPAQADGVLRVDLTAIQQADDLVPAIAAACRVPIDPQAALASLTRALRPLHALMLLDNADSWVEAVADVVEALLEDCPDLYVIVTSQAPLPLRSAPTYHLEPLAVPAAGASASVAFRFGAVALLAERMLAADRHAILDAHHTPDAIAVCRQLDGLPLAIELIAPRCVNLGLARVRAELPLRCRSKPGESAPTIQERQRDLGAVMGWSYGLLDADQQKAFRSLGVCVGGFGLDFAKALLPPHSENARDGMELLAGLVDHSLVAVDSYPTGQMHYRLLEPARLYALGLLEQSDEEYAARDDHAAAAAKLANAAYQDYWHQPESTFIARYERDLDNLRSAIGWCMQCRHTALAVDLAGATGPLWRCLSLHHEGVGLLERVAAMPGAKRYGAASARLLSSISLLYGESASVAGREPARAAAALYEQVGDVQGQYLALAHLAYSYRYADGEEALWAYDNLKRLEDPHWPAAVRLFGARIEPARGTPQERLREGRVANELRHALATASGSEYEANCALVNLADIALTSGDIGEAIRLNRDLLARLSRRHMASRIIVLGNLVGALVLGGELEAAQSATLEFLDAARTLNFMFGMFVADALALMCAMRGDPGAAAHLVGYADHSYGSKHRGRGPNEQLMHERTLQLLQGSANDAERTSWMERGARLSAESACLLAISAGKLCAADGPGQHSQHRG